MFVYKITNIINGKVYVGMDSQPVKKMSRWKDHLSSYKNVNINKNLYKAFRKYGIENFSYTVIEEVTSQELLRKRETFWITYYNSVHNGYNMQYGGGSPLLETLSENDQKRLRKVRAQNFIKFNKERWSNTTADERKEILKNTANSESASLKISKATKDNWDSLTERKRTEKSRT